MDIRDNDALLEQLAAEYALGTLQGAARRRFEAMMKSDRALEARVLRWNAYLGSLAELLPPVSPPERVWTRIVARLPGAPTRASQGWWQSLAFWRGLAVAMSVLAVLAIDIAVQTRNATPVSVAMAPAPDYVATFAAPDTKQPVAVITMPAHGNQVMLQVVAPDLVVPKGKALQLWLIKPGTTTMISAGVAPTMDEAHVVRFVVADASDLRGAKTLGLSLEPAGGSPQPTQALGFATWVKA